MIRFRKENLQNGNLTLSVQHKEGEAYQKEVYHMGANFGDDEWEKFRRGFLFGQNPLYQKIKDHERSIREK